MLVTHAGDSRNAVALVAGSRSRREPAMRGGSTVHEDSRSAVHLVLPPEPKLDMQELRTASGGVCSMQPCW